MPDSPFFRKSPGAAKETPKPDAIASGTAIRTTVHVAEDERAS